MNRIIIGLSGKKRSGKDTTYRIINKYLVCRRIALGDYVKEDVANFLSPVLTREEIDGPNKELIRPVIKSYGQLMRDIVTQDYWVRLLNFDIQQTKENIVVTDIRYGNEADYIKNSGGILVRITRDNDDDSDDHPSETELDSYPMDWYILNTTEEELEKEIVRFLKAKKLIEE